jgi:uncharacterized protein DUF4136
MKIRASILVPATFIFAGIVYAAVQTDYDHHADFSRYHTYSWIGIQSGNPLWKERIMNAVDSALAAKGLTRVESDGDMAVSAFGRTQERDTLETFYTGFPGWGWRARWWGGGMGTATTDVIPEKVGNLTVDLFDGHTKQLAWRGVASDTLADKPDKNEKKLDQSVEEMFKHFPPKGKG